MGADLCGLIENPFLDPAIRSAALTELPDITSVINQTQQLGSFVTEPSSSTHTQRHQHQRLPPTAHQHHQHTQLVHRQRIPRQCQHQMGKEGAGGHGVETILD